MDTSLKTLSATSCVVKACFPNLKSESSACGSMLDPVRGLIISHGSLLTEYCAENKLLSAKVRDGSLLQSGDLSGSDFSVLLSHDLFPKELWGDLETQSALITVGTSSFSTENNSSSNRNEGDNHEENPSSGFIEVKCHLVSAFRNNDFHQTLCKMMPSSVWTLNDTISDNGVSNTDSNMDDKHDKNEKTDFGNNELGDVSYDLLSYFLLFAVNYSDLGISKESISKSGLKTVSPQTCRRGRCVTGETAEIIATPFGSLCPAVFYNGYSRGVISNVGGIKDCWIVTDARCIPGCEGGPLFTKRKPTDKDSFLTGIITSPLCWKNSEWVGFSVACSMDSILRSMVQHQETFSNFGKKYPISSTRNQNCSHMKHPPMRRMKAQALTVLIQCGSTWGTGVIINRDKGVILTCSHVVKGADLYSVTVTPSKSIVQHTARVVYRQDPVRTAYDLAVLKCTQATKHLPKAWCVPVAHARVGDDIMLSGHAVFSTDRNLEPSICQGVVSKVIGNRGKPVLVQTTCAVHAGTSGGPLLTLGGCLVGIVVCNTRDSTSNTSFPHVNLCIPISAVWPVVNNYLSTGDKACLSQLQVQDEDLNQLWALGAQTSHDTQAGSARSKL